MDGELTPTVHYLSVEDKLGIRIYRLETILQVYANPENWKDDDFGFCELDKDRGELARFCLNEERKLY